MSRPALTGATALSMVAMLVVGNSMLVTGAIAAGAASAEWEQRTPANTDYRDSKHVDTWTVRLLAARDGTAIAVWTSQIDSRFYVEGARRPPGGTWSEPTVIAEMSAIYATGLSDAWVDP